DYIVNTKGRDHDDDAPDNYIRHSNWHEDVNIQGIEVELDYDIGWFFTNISYARQKTDQPLNFTDASPNVNTSANKTMYTQGYGLTKLTMLPRDY
ncbi:hypothetical protein, partial [Campylobacter portucalensis]|uniref:hypothetical protein n=1 Tax=Campylobacter portucalensis TaxID=2608384 RepID=UPI001E56E036